MARRKGKCACDAVRWETSAPDLWAGHCHCESCRRASAAPFTSFFGVPSDSLVWFGDITTRKSSEQVERGFCATCGTQMYYHSKQWPDETHLYAATLEDATEFKPQAHFHWGERVPWITVNDDLPKFAASADGADPIGDDA